MNSFKKILLVEDNPRDVELTLEALAEHNLANDVVVANDGADCHSLDASTDGAGG